MSQLNSEARALIAAGRSELSPTQSDRSRVTGLLIDRMGTAGQGLTVPVPQAAATVSSGVLKLLTIAATLGVVCVIGTVTYLAKRDTAAAPVRSVSVVAASAEAVPVAVQAPEPPAASSVAASTRDPEFAPEPGLHSSKPSRDSLGDEVKILSRAERELQGGKPSMALRALDEHQRRFPHGALAQERSAARIQALCALGRTQEANVESAKLVRTSPNSPQAAHAALPCGPAR